MAKHGDRVEPTSDTAKHFGPGTVQFEQTHSDGNTTVHMVTDRTGCWLAVNAKDVKPAK